MICLLILLVVGFRLRIRGRGYLAGFGLFGIYLMAVIDLMFFSILFPENYPANLSWEGTLQALESINLIPFKYGAGNYFTSFIHAYRDVLRNILLTIPLGIGIRFLTPLRGKWVLLFALGTGLFFEGVQLTVKLVFGIYYHAVDINDVLNNALGVLVGYGIAQAIIAWGISRLRR